jgi:hypothetical protein
MMTETVGVCRVTWSWMIRRVKSANSQHIDDTRRQQSQEETDDQLPEEEEEMNKKPRKSINISLLREQLARPGDEH